MHVASRKTYVVPMSGYSQSKSFDVVAETRRRWSADERRQILEETLSSPVSVVARRHGIAASLVFRWRRQAGMWKQKGEAGGFVPVMLPAPQAASSVAGPGSERGMIELELAGGHKLRVMGPVEVDLLKQVLAILDGR
jgi:transposase